ncbi:Heptaprenyl diphosphate synthase component 2 [termite gut metagenome]|uniref:Heptaprenyl diphosphate synthase component 2 n=1 Tax=termite gut metagenome TaxID=433724 RepID=A0A5J4SXC3_9ZZZZ
MNSLDLIQSPIIKELENFKDLYDCALLSDNPLFNNVVVHLKQRKGKMMRPILVLLMAKLYGDVRIEAFYAAISLELLHTASLLHDDVVDESPERRGQQSVNAVFDNKIAILTGDYLLAICLAEARKTNNNDIIVTVLDLARNLAGGELLQLANLKNQFFSEKLYFDVIIKKTAVLFSACTKSAALSMKITVDNVECSRLFGQYIGICFQIRDDIFGYFDNIEIGKPSGSDMLEGRLTLPAIYALNTFSDERARSIALKVKNRAASTEEINELTEFVKRHDGIECAQRKMNDYRKKAIDMLSRFPNTDVKAALIEYANYVVEREI